MWKKSIGSLNQFSYFVLLCIIYKVLVLCRILQNKLFQIHTNACKFYCYFFCKQQKSLDRYKLVLQSLSKTLKTTSSSCYQLSSDYFPPDPGNNWSLTRCGPSRAVLAIHVALKLSPGLPWDARRQGFGTPGLANTGLSAMCRHGKRC